MEALLSGFACAPGLQSLRLGASLVLSLTETTNCSADCHPVSPSYHSHSKHHSRASPHSAPSSWSLRCQGRAGSPWKGRASSFPRVCYLVSEGSAYCQGSTGAACSVASVMSDFVPLWTVALQAPLFMELSRQEYWSGLPFPSPGDLADPETEPRSPALQADSLSLSYQGSPVL